MSLKNFILVQNRANNDFEYFLERYYRFHNSEKSLFTTPSKFIYYDEYDDEFYGCGEIVKTFPDKRDKDFTYAEIVQYKDFNKCVKLKNSSTNELAISKSIIPINSQQLEEICLDGGIRLNFKADSHLVQVLGEQLIASERVGILELVKNAYDANAKNCTVLFEKINSIEQTPEEYKFIEFDGPVIVITDDGNGMNRDVIENGWLRPASTIKTNVKEQIKQQRKEAIEKGDIGIYNRWLDQYKKANKGRLPLGEKGVGRFATHRLGNRLLIKTKTKEIDYEYILSINWDDFDMISGEYKDLDSVAVSLTRQPLSRDYGSSNSGTQIIISGGRNGFDLRKEIIEEIHESIEKLNSPDLNNLKNRKEKKVDSNVFNAKVICPQIGEFVTESIYDLAQPVFSLDGIVDENGILNYDLTFNPPTSNLMPFQSEKLAVDEFLDLRKTIDKNNPFFVTTGEYRKPECGSFYIHLDLWYRTSPWIDAINTRKVSELLDDYGGVSIYRDSVNLFPAEWGAEIDWLNLSKRHIKKGSNLSYYNMMGYIEIDQSKNIDLIDKTDRQGLIENRAFNDLSQLVASVVFRSELDYKQKRDNLTDIRKTIIKDPTALNVVSNQSSSIVDNIIDRYDIVKDPIQLFDSITSLNNPLEREEKLFDLTRSLKELEKSAKQMGLIQEQLIEEAGFGKAVAVSIHELAKTTTNLYNGIIQVLKSDDPDPKLLEGLKNASGSLRSELKNLSPLRTIRNEKREEFEIIKSIEFVQSVFKRKFTNSNIEFICNEEESFTIFDRYGAINQIFSNLIDNSVHWLGTLDKNHPNFNSKRIEIKLDKEQRLITVADNGPGIHNAIMPYLFQSGASMRNPPSGLGLYVCRYYMNRLKGEIYLASKQSEIQNMKGAQFSLDFSRSPATKEDYK